MNRLGIRLLDVVVASISLSLLSPFLLAMAVAVRATSHGPALFRSTRIGRNARPFALYKFRSMKDDASKAGPRITAAGDSRVTSVGRFMRSHKLDELPQLLNVLKGDMSLVGPRPEDPKYVASYSRDQLRILDVKPGMTSPASLSYSDEECRLIGEDWEKTYISNFMPAKLAIDAKYLETRTVLADVKVIMATLAVLLLPERRGRSDA
ncbi:MAG: sugar transferase [Actinobacteria bacterium]|nr:sugar transferase [Actinomycetota bacterium]